MYSAKGWVDCNWRIFDRKESGGMGKGSFVFWEWGCPNRYWSLQCDETITSCESSDYMSGFKTGKCNNYIGWKAKGGWFWYCQNLSDGAEQRHGDDGNSGVCSTGAVRFWTDGRENRHLWDWSIAKLFAYSTISGRADCRGKAAWNHKLLYEAWAECPFSECGGVGKCFVHIDWYSWNGRICCENRYNGSQKQYRWEFA